MAEENEQREAYIIKAKIAEQAERYEDMVKFMGEVVRTSKKQLQTDERNLLSVAYKNVVGARRSAFRVVSSLSPKDDSSDGGPTKGVLSQFSSDIKKELEKNCQDILDLLDEYLIDKNYVIPEGGQTTKDSQSKQSGDEKALSQVFYLKMKGDYYRYLVEVNLGEERKKNAQLSLEAYEKATAISEAEVEVTNPIRLGLALNFSVFYYEIEMNPKKACELAKSAFDEAISQLDNLSEESYKDSTLIMQLLRDNLTLWTSDENSTADEPAEQTEN